jgi:hypothetical protein
MGFKAALETQQGRLVVSRRVVWRSRSSGADELDVRRRGYRVVGYEHPPCYSLNVPMRPKSTRQRGLFGLSVAGKACIRQRSHVILQCRNASVLAKNRTYDPLSCAGMLFAAVPGSDRHLA